MAGLIFRRKLVLVSRGAYIRGAYIRDFPYVYFKSQKVSSICMFAPCIAIERAKYTKEIEPTVMSDDFDFLFVGTHGEDINSLLLVRGGIRTRWPFFILISLCIFF